MQTTEQLLVQEVYDLQRRIDSFVWETTHSMNPQDYYFPENIECFWYPDPNEPGDVNEYCDWV